MNHSVAPWCCDKKGLWGPPGRRGGGGHGPGQGPAGQGRLCGRLSQAGQGVSLLKNNRSPRLLLSGSESSSTPGNGATPEECPALADSPTTLTEALQMIRPIPADSWRNLIEQIGGCPGGGAASRGKCGFLVDSERPPAREMLLGFCERMHLLWLRHVFDIVGSNWFHRLNCRLFVVLSNEALASGFLSCSLQRGLPA